MITISPTKVSIALGSTQQLTSSATAKWESDKPAIASVSQLGLVRAGAGERIESVLRHRRNCSNQCDGIESRRQSDRSASGM